MKRNDTLSCNGSKYRPVVTKYSISYCLCSCNQRFVTCTKDLLVSLRNAVIRQLLYFLNKKMVSPSASSIFVQFAPRPQTLYYISLSSTRWKYGRVLARSAPYQGSSHITVNQIVISRAMGKPVEFSANNLRLRCVHCKTTETPLWRGGPDGPKTLCNACGVRFKKGKLALYKDENGNITAIKSENALPVVVPPTSKKSTKKVSQTGSAASSQELKRTIVRKSLPPDSAATAIAAAVGKKPRARSRRATAGQLPGRYASKCYSYDLLHWRSPSCSPSSTPSSPAASPDERGESLFSLLLQYMFECSIADLLCLKINASTEGRTTTRFLEQPNMFELGRAVIISVS